MGTVLCKHLSRKDVRPWQGRQGEGKGKVEVEQGRASVSCWKDPQAPQEGQLCKEGRGWRPGLPGRRDGVPGRRDPRACRERREGQQEDQDHPEAPPAGGEERRGAEQAPGWGDDRPGWSPPQHPGCPPPQEVAGREDQVGQPGDLNLFYPQQKKALLRATNQNIRRFTL